MTAAGKLLRLLCWNEEERFDSIPSVNNLHKMSLVSNNREEVKRKKNKKEATNFSFLPRGGKSIRPGTGISPDSQLLLKIQSITFKGIGGDGEKSAKEVRRGK